MVGNTMPPTLMIGVDGLDGIENTMVLSSGLNASYIDEWDDIYMLFLKNYIKDIYDEMISQLDSMVIFRQTCNYLKQYVFITKYMINVSNITKIFQ